MAVELSDRELFEDENNRYWKTVVDTMADGLMIVDTRGVIVSVNAAMARMTGYRTNELIGHRCDILECNVCMDEQSRGQDKHCALFRQGTIRRFKCTLKRKNGELLYVIKNASTIRDAGGHVVGGVETLTDLTEVVAMEHEIADLRRTLSQGAEFHGMIGASAAMEQVYNLIVSAAESDAPVVITGESGTGKELAAGAIHRRGPRNKGNFIRVNCAALNESLLESELFGHVKGAFTGADRSRMGRFEAAAGGDIFLDEIGDIPPSTQVKLLRVLQEKEVERVGDHRPISIDVRVIAATNRDLKERITGGAFREDLYYRINVIPIHMPALRERKEDIPLLVNTFTRRIREKSGKPIEGFSDAAMNRLFQYDWPGNVRELANAIEYAFVLCRNGLILPAHLPRQITGAKEPAPAPPVAERSESHRKNGRTSVVKALQETGGNKTQAAKRLGISRVALYKRMRKYGIPLDHHHQ
jgi:PAS domain S-box-containing protein